MKRVPLALQSAKSECGIACLAMITGYYDGASDLAGMRARFGDAQQGVTLKQLTVMAVSLGFITRGLRLEPSQLSQLRLPAVLHWQMDHFVVLVRVNRRGALLHDPAEGEVWVTWAEVDRCFTGVALEIWPAGGELQIQRAPRLTIKDIFALAGGFNVSLVWLVLLSLVLQLLVLMAPWHMQWTVDEALVKGDAHLIGVLGLGFAFVLACRCATYYLRGLLVMQLGYHMSFHMACRLYHHLLHLGLSWYESRHVGDIVSRFNDLEPYRLLFTQGMAALLVDTLIVVLSLLLMLVYSAKLALIVLLCHFGVLAIYLLWTPKLRRLAMGTIVAKAQEQSSVLEAVRCVHNVKVYGQEQGRLQHWQSKHSQVLSKSMQVSRIQLGLNSWQISVAGAELLVSIYVGAHMVMQGGFTLGMLLAFISYRGHFSERMRTLADQVLQLRTLPAHAERLSEVMCSETENVTLQVPGQACDLNLHEVGMRHAGRQAWLFRGLTLHVPQGSYIGLVGASGSGKTTLLKVMMGLLPPDEGALCLDKTQLSTPLLAGYRQLTGCVLQADGFFSGSLLDNVTLFETPQMAQVNACLTAVGIQEMVQRLPMGVYTQMGEVGGGFSTGQLQRLLLARALYRHPKFLFLDECTANLDQQAAQQVMALIGSLNCTRVVIAHDPELLAEADVVYVLEGGELKSLSRKSSVGPKSGAIESLG